MLDFTTYPNILLMIAGGALISFGLLLIAWSEYQKHLYYKKRRQQARSAPADAGGSPPADGISAAGGEARLRNASQSTSEHAG